MMSCVADRPEAARRTGYDVVRIVLGIVLLSAAVLKGHQLATEPVAETSLFTSRWFLIGVVEFELFFGLWLLAGLYPRRTWAAALFCFSGFACVSLYKAISGEATCGCFGRVPVNPWYTFVLDLAAAAALLRWRPATAPTSSPLPLAGEGPGVRAGLRGQLACVLGTSLLVGLPAALVMGSYQAATLDEAGGIFGDSEVVVLEPETWIGKRFPVVKHIDVGERLVRGTWVVLLYDHSCSACRDAVSEYEELGEDFSRSSGSFTPDIAMVECPPYAKKTSLPESGAWVRGRLKNSKRWKLPGPVAILIDEGEVKTVFENARDMDLLRAIWGKE